MERLSRQDLITLWPEDVGWPQDMAAVGTLAAEPLCDPDGRLRLDAVRASIEGRLQLVPRFRQVLYQPPFWLGKPVWVDDAAFDVAHHVRVARVGAPGDEAQLLEAVERIRRQHPLDRSRPLWQVWFLSGLSEDRVGLYLRVHHVVADGPVAVAMAMGLLGRGNADAEAGAGPAPAWHPVPRPTDRELLKDHLARIVAALRRTLATAGHPAAALRSTGTAWRALRSVVAEGSAPRSSLNRPIGAHRRLTLIRTDLDSVAGIAHEHDAKINDVVLTAVAGGLRDLLRSRGEPVDGVVLRAFVPVSLHGRDAAAGGNRLGMVVASLPVGIADPAERLGRIAVASAAQKRAGDAMAGAAFRNAPMPRASVRFLARQRSANTQVSNVPGPRARLSLLGAPLLEVFPFVPLMGNLPLIVGALSYAGQFNIAVVSDPQACPDVDLFAAGLRGTLAALRIPDPSTMG